MTLSKKAPVKRVYRSWDEEDKAQVIAEAHRIKADDPSINTLVLVKKAQQILGPDKQRPINTVSTAAYEWFHIGLAKLAKKPAKPKPPSKKPTPPSKTPPVSPPPAKPLQQEPIEVSTPVVETKIVETPVERPVASELTEISTLEVLHAIVDALRENTAALTDLKKSLTGQIVEVRNDLQRQQERLGKLPLQNGANQVVATSSEDVRRELRSQRDLLDKTHTVVSGIAHNLSVIERRQPVLSPDRFVQPPKVENKSDTRLRIVILGIDSGHWKSHIREAVGSQCRALDFELAVGEPKPYKDYDAIIVTKKVPDTWWYWASRTSVVDQRWVRVSGACHEITLFIRKMIDTWTIRQNSPSV